MFEPVFYKLIVLTLSIKFSFYLLLVSVYISMHLIVLTKKQKVSKFFLSLYFSFIAFHLYPQFKTIKSKGFIWNAFN
jgi:hypothetical protein